MEKCKLISKISNFLDCSKEIAELYVQILEKPQSKDEIAEMPGTKSEALEFLLFNCLVSEYSDKRNGGKVIRFAVDPQYSMSAVLLNAAWKRDSELHTLMDLENRTDIPDLFEKYKVLKEISNELQKIYIRQLPYFEEITIVATGKNKVTSSLAAQLSEAHENIFAVVSPPQLMGEIIWQTIRERISKGVNYCRITEFDEVIRHGIKIASLESEMEEMYIITGSMLPEKFYVIDNQSVVFFEKGKDRTKFIQKIQIIKNKGLALHFYERYKKALIDCVDFRTLVPKVEAYRKIFIENAGNLVDDRILIWLSDIFNNGVFYSKGKYDKQFISRAIDICKEKGLIKLLNDGTVVANYKLSDLLQCG